MSLSDIRDSLQNFQRLTGLRPTGILDTETITMMNRPRCGNREDEEMITYSFHNSSTSTHQNDRYSLQGVKWEKPFVSYKIVQYSRQRLSQAEIDWEIHRAFQIWAQETSIQFIRSNANEART
jgi:hypothetical protein